MQWSPTRREFLGVAGAGGFAPASVGNVSWGNATDVVPDNPFASEPEIRWSLGLGDPSLLLAEPVDDALYVGAPGAIYAVSTDGTRRWRRELGLNHPNVVVGPKSAPPGTSRTVYVSNDTDRIYALDHNGGEVRWHYEGEEFPSVISAVRDIAVVLDGDLVAVSASDGRERWRFDLDGSPRGPPGHDGQLLYVGTDRRKLYALDLDDGTERWRVELPESDGEPESTFSQLRIVETVADLTFAWDFGTRTLYAFETNDGTERWRVRTARDVHWFPGTVRSHVVYLTDGKTLRALSVADGTERWRFDAESKLSWIPRVAGDTVYVGSEERIYAVSVGKGRERWRSGATTVPFAVTRDSLVATDIGDSIYGLSVHDGRVRWKYDVEASLTSSPHVHDGSVYFGTDSGTFSALSVPCSSLACEAYRTVASPVGVAVGGLLGGALAVGAYRRRTRDEPPVDPPEPETFGDFELVALVAESEVAEVYEARTPSGERVTLRRFTPGDLSDERLSDEQFAEAIRTWANLNHEGVLEVREWGTDPVPWVATEYADATLADRAADLTTEELAHAVADVAETVHRAHCDSIAHGRLAPEHVWFADDDVRVGGWRLAAESRNSPAEDATRADDIDRLAEMARDLLAAEQVADLSEVLARAPAPDSTDSSSLTGCSDPVDGIDSSDPADRYESALKFADALRWTVRE